MVTSTLKSSSSSNDPSVMAHQPSGSRFLSCPSSSWRCGRSITLVIVSFRISPPFPLLVGDPTNSLGKGGKLVFNILVAKSLRRGGAVR